MLTLVALVEDQAKEVLCPDEIAIGLAFRMMVGADGAGGGVTPPVLPPPPQVKASKHADADKTTLNSQRMRSLQACIDTNCVIQNINTELFVFNPKIPFADLQQLCPSNPSGFQQEGERIRKFAYLQACRSNQDFPGKKRARSLARIALVATPAASQTSRLLSA
jgi:hypothetical protein